MEKLDEDTLFLAATRPALVAGVPLPLAGLFLMIAGFIIVFLKNPLYEVLMVPLWFGAKVLVSRDYNAVNVAYIAIRTSGRAIDRSVWGGASVSPNPVRVPKRGRGIV
ncbi:MULTISPECIES: type IV secretion system protein VirB3 [Bombella]|uniref:Type IV secretion system protein VirB3 n=3 Tax=Bombella TaxID=1654741 RepID=A0A1S8GSE7_9PROT|nr:MULTISPECIES: type IV secretion system protein VirB3 [Bombella]MBA5724675.1 type IV secretion system protein VirB3 [Bombella favorum]MBA5727313.1 type IV secretion system protein VirB3 [Bombella mellum]OOL19961.1 type IV secretion system protein VirB3 [Bombella intestini]